MLGQQLDIHEYNSLFNPEETRLVSPGKQQVQIMYLLWMWHWMWKQKNRTLRREVLASTRFLLNGSETLRRKVHWVLKEILHCHRKSESHYSTQIHKMLSHVTQMVIPTWYLVVGTCKEDGNDYEDAWEGAAWAGFGCVGCEMVTAKSMKYSVKLDW